MTGLGNGGTSEMARSNEHALGSSAHCATKVVDFRTANSVAPPLDLSLDVCPSEKLVGLVDIPVHVNPAITRQPRNGYADESAALHHSLDEVLKVVGRKLQHLDAKFLDFHD